MDETSFIFSTIQKETHAPKSRLIALPYPRFYCCQLLLWQAVPEFSMATMNHGGTQIESASE